MQFEKNTGKIS